MSALKKVLVVDDDPVVGRSFNRVLSRKGYVVINAANGEEALSKLTTETYDAVFTDIRMPGMSGLEVAERVRAKQPWMPVVIITGYGSDDAEARAKAAGVHEFLRKPLLPEMIETVAASATAAPKEAPAAVTATHAPAAPAVAAAAEPENAGSVLKNLGTMLIAPFAALAFVLLFPIVGLAMLARYGMQAYRARHAARKPLHPALMVARNLTLFFAAPFIALAYLAAFPFFAAVMMLRMSLEAWRRRAETA